MPDRLAEDRSSAQAHNAGSPATCSSLEVFGGSGTTVSRQLWKPFRRGSPSVLFSLGVWFGIDFRAAICFAWAGATL